MALIFFAIFALALAGAVLVAFRYGGRDEKRVAVILLMAAFATPFMQAQSFELSQHGLILVDGALLLALIEVALTSDRHWPMFAAAFQMTTIFFHVARGSGAGIVPDAYADSLVFWGYLVIGALIAGTLIEAREERP